MSGVKLAYEVFGEEIYSRLTRAGNAELIITERDVVRYSDMLRNVRSFCGSFDACQAKRGDRVLILTSNEEVAISAFLSAMFEGLTPVMLTPDTAADRAASIFSLVEPAVTVIDSQRASEEWLSGNVMVVQTAKKAGLLSQFMGSKTQLPLTFDGTARDPKFQGKPDDLAYILFTSGTTSFPAGVEITHANLVNQLQTLSRLFEITPDSRMFNSMVLAHADGLIQGPVLAVFCGCAVIRPFAFSLARLEDWLNTARKNRATHFITVPTVFAMIDRYAKHSDYFDATEFKMLLSCAAKLEVDLWERLQTRFKRPLFNQYGLTETVTSGLYAGPHPEMGPLGTIGKPIDVSAKVINLDGSPSADGEVGELVLLGSTISPGYWKNDERTQQSRTKDGWYKSGDLVKKRPDGAYEIVGRLKTVIMTGGFLIRPDEIDEVLSKHPNVVECATVAIEDSDFGEIPVSAVVLSDPISEVELTSHCRSGLEEMKIPKRIIAIDKIPRGVSGKTQVKELQSLLQSLLTDPDEDTGVEAAMASGVMAIAAKVFRVKPEALSAMSSPENTRGWDSFSQINLILSVEKTFGCRIPASRVAAIQNLGDLVGALKAARLGA